MPGRYLIANWKMNLPPEGIETYVRRVSEGAHKETVLVIGAPFPYLRDVSSAADERIGVAAQNCSDQPSGAFTGEVSISMLRDCGARYVILGHSERRTIYGETDAFVARKLAIAHANGITPLFCVGEDLRTRDLGEVSRFLANQVRAAAAADLENAREIVIAYEPVWAIGTGRNASGLMVAETVEFIREAVTRFWPARFAEVPIVYGGSVTPENVTDLVSHGRVDGFLVGGAALDSGKFLAIEKALSGP
jgi:triosephosphate isomerase (TIM)